VSEPEAALARLAEALQEHVNAQEDDGLVVQAVIVYETVNIEEDGETVRRVAYTIPTDNFAISGALGLCDAGRHLIRRDALGSSEDD
jgi:hypothetical protein